jgi:hypothetical protein
VAKVVIRGGDRIDAYVQKLASKLAAGGVLRVGFLEDAEYPDGTSVAMVAAIQNFGAPAANIPPRPFFSNMVKDEANNWGPLLSNILFNVNYDVEKSLKRLGLGIQGQLRKSIDNTNAPPLAAATIAAKGFEKPLIDTGNMRMSVAYKVDMGS